MQLSVSPLLVLGLRSGLDPNLNGRSLKIVTAFKLWFIFVYFYTLGIGPKRAIDLIKQHRTIEGILKHIDTKASIITVYGFKIIPFITTPPFGKLYSSSKMDMSTLSNSAETAFIIILLVVRSTLGFLDKRSRINPHDKLTRQNGLALLV